MRINLHGEPVARVTPEGQAHAQQKVAHILACREARARRAEARGARANQPATPPRTNAKTPVSTPAPVKSTQTLPIVIVKKRRQVVIPPR